MDTRKSWTQLTRWLGAIAAVAASLYTMNLCAMHVWAAGFPPPDRAQWHLHWANIFAAVSIALLVSAAALIWFLRPIRPLRPSAA